MKKKLLAALALWWTGSSPAWAQFQGCPGGICSPVPYHPAAIQVANHGTPSGYPVYQGQIHQGQASPAPMPAHGRVPFQPYPAYPYPAYPYHPAGMPQVPAGAWGMPAGAQGGVVPAAFRGQPTGRPAAQSAAAPSPTGSPMNMARADAPVRFLPPAEPYIGTGLPAPQSPGVGSTGNPPGTEEVQPPVDPLPAVDNLPVETGPVILPAGAVVENPPEPVIRQYVDPLERPLSKGVLWYGSAEYLRWWLQDQKDVPPSTVVTQGGPVTLQADPDNDERTGGRFHLGRWINPLRTIALEGDFLFLGQRQPSSTVNAQGVTASMIPIFDGIDRVDRRIQYHERFQQIELGLRWKAWERPSWHLDLLAGGRYFELDEAINVTSSTTFTQNPVLLSDAVVRTVDLFGTDNRFIGGQIGFETEYACGWWYVQVVGKVAVGNNRQRLSVNGLTSVTAPPQPLGNLAVPGGLFAGGTNIGDTGRNRLAVVPEMGVWTGVRLNRYAKLSVGYDFLWISDALRPADQLDPAVAQASPLSFLGPPFAPPLPRSIFESTSVWAMGVGLRLELQY